MSSLDTYLHALATSILLGKMCDTDDHCWNWALLRMLYQMLHGTTMKVVILTVSFLVTWYYHH
jgi:hypothetical protein